MLTDWYCYLENNPKKIRVLIGLKSRVIIIRNTELVQAVDVMMAWEKRVYILIIKVSKLFTFRRIFWK